MLAARGEEVEGMDVKETMGLIRKVFPQSDMFKFVTPEKEKFLKLVTGVTDLNQEDYNRKVDTMLDMMDKM